MTKYAVITNTTVVHTTDDESGAIDYAAGLHPDAKYLPFVTENDLRENQSYGPGRYILSDIRTTWLFEKVINVQPGYFFKTETPELKLLTVWTMLTIDEAVEQNLSGKQTSASSQKPSATWSPTIGSGTTNNSTISNGSTVQTPVPIPIIVKPISTKIEVTPIVRPTVHKPVNVSVVPSVEPPTSVPKNVSTNQSVNPVAIPIVAPVVNQPSVKAPIMVPKNVPTTVPNGTPVNNVPVSQPAHKAVPPTPAPSVTPTAPPTLTVLATVASSPYIMSIGNQQKQQREKIEMIVNHNIVSGELREDNLVIVTDNEKVGEAWNKKYPSCFVYGKPDDDLLYYLTTQPQRSGVKNINKLVIFDHCLTREFSEKNQFVNFITNSVTNKMGVIVMTQSPDIICSPLMNQYLTKILLHSFVVDWAQKVSADFIRRHPFLKDQRNLEEYMVRGIRANACIVINKAKFGDVELF